MDNGQWISTVKAVLCYLLAKLLHTLTQVIRLLFLHVSLHFTLLKHHFLPPVNCSDPIPPMNGSIHPYQNTTEGAEIFFRCNLMFVPAERMTAVCGADGRWNPDPATLVCKCEIIIGSSNHFTSTCNLQYLGDAVDCGRS